MTGIDAQLAELRRRWTGHWPEADPAQLAADVRDRLAAAIAAWQLDAVAPLPGGHVALVCAARRDADPVVVKVSPGGTPDDAQLAAEAPALVFWRDTGAVPRVLGQRDGGLTLLMERVAPGVALDDAGLPWAARLTTLGRLAARLHAAGPPPDGLPPMTEYASYWRRALADDAPLAAALEELAAPRRDDVLIHADLHGGNALRHGDGWRVIDPHAVHGDRHADVWALIDPLAPELPADAAAAAQTARSWVAHYAAAAGLDAERAAAWVVIRARAEALGVDAADAAPADERAWAQRLHRMADALRPRR